MANNNAKENQELLQEVIKNQDVKLVKEILEKGVDPSFFNDSEDLLINHAIRTGNLEIVKLLLEHGAKANSDFLPSPLFLSINRKNTQMVELLLKHGGNPNHGRQNEDEESVNLLLHAISWGASNSLIEALIVNGANVNCVEDNQSPLDLAIDKENVELQDLLKRHGAKSHAKPNLSHRNLLLVMESLGYQVDIGTCAGFCLMGIQASYVQNGINSFNERLKMVDKIVKKALNPPGRSSDEIKKNIRKMIDSLGDVKRTDLYAFFDGVNLNQRPYVTPHLFGDNAPKEQFTDDVFPLIQSLALNENITSVHPPITFAFTATEEIEDFLIKLKSCFDGDTLTAYIGSGKHATALIYKDNAWTYLDANHIDLQSYSTEKELASALVNAHSADPEVFMGILRFYTMQSNADALSAKTENLRSFCINKSLENPEQLLRLNQKCLDDETTQDFLASIPHKPETLLPYLPTLLKVSNQLNMQLQYYKLVDLTKQCLNIFLDKNDTAMFDNLLSLTNPETMLQMITSSTGDESILMKSLHHKEIFDLLIEKIFDVNNVSDMGMSFIRFNSAIEKNASNSMNILLEDFTQQCLNIFLEKKDTTMFDKLLSVTNPESMLNIVTSRSSSGDESILMKSLHHKEIFDLLIEKVIDVNYVSDMGMSLFSHAIERNASNAMSTLLDKVDIHDVLHRENDATGMNPLLLAIQLKKPNIVQLVLDRKPVFTHTEKQAIFKLCKENNQPDITSMFNEYIQKQQSSYYSVTGLKTLFQPPSHVSEKNTPTAPSNTPKNK